jgi:hypothetical protein
MFKLMRLLGRAESGKHKGIPAGGAVEGHQGAISMKISKMARISWV